MDQFTVPQFIEIEPKIIGPITARQFLIILVGGITAVFSYKLADFTLFIFETLIILSLVYLFGWFRPGGQMFHYFLLNFIQSIFKKPSLRVWHKEIIRAKDVKEIKSIGEKELIAPELIRKRLIASKLSELSLIVDTGGVYKGE